jgi:histone H2B
MPAKRKPKSILLQKERKRSRTNGRAYSIYLRRVLLQIHPDLGMSKRTLSILNSFLNDLFEQIAREASNLCKYSRKKTLSEREIQAAVRLVIPSEIAQHAVSEGKKAFSRYIFSTE